MGIICFAGGVQGFIINKLNIYQRVAVAGAGFMMIIPQTITFFSGIIVLCITLIFSTEKIKNSLFNLNISRGK